MCCGSYVTVPGVLPMFVAAFCMGVIGVGVGDVMGMVVALVLVGSCQLLAAWSSFA